MTFAAVPSITEPAIHVPSIIHGWSPKNKMQAIPATTIPTAYARDGGAADFRNPDDAIQASIT